jgi:hypothetical protein
MTGEQTERESVTGLGDVSKAVCGNCLLWLLLHVNYRKKMDQFFSPPSPFHLSDRSHSFSLL